MPDFPPVLTQLLVQREADLFAENENRETPCDCAEKQHHKELALSLESQMVFSLAPEAEGIEAEYAALDRKEVQTHAAALSGWTINHFTCCMSAMEHPESVTVRLSRAVYSQHPTFFTFAPFSMCCHAAVRGSAASGPPQAKRHADRGDGRHAAGPTVHC